MKHLFKFQSKHSAFPKPILIKENTKVEECDSLISSDNDSLISSDNDGDLNTNKSQSMILFLSLLININLYFRVESTLQYFIFG